MSENQPALEGLCKNPAALKKLLEDLINTMTLHVKETERVLAHVEQHTDQLIPPSQFGLIVSELSELHARLQH